MACSCTHHTPVWLPSITTLSSDLLTLPTQVSSALTQTQTSLELLYLRMKKPFHLFCRYTQHSGAAGHPVPSGAEPGGAALGGASGGREAAGPPDPGAGRVPGEGLRRMEGPGSQITHLKPRGCVAPGEPRCVVRCQTIALISLVTVRDV